MAINTVILEGLITKELDIRDAGSHKVCTSSLCVNFYEKGEKASEFFALEMWNNIGTQAQEKLAKGDICLVQGRLKLKQWTGKDGTPKKEWCIVVSQIDKIRERGLASAEMPMSKATKTETVNKSGEIDWDNLNLPF